MVPHPIIKKKKKEKKKKSIRNETKWAFQETSSFLSPVPHNQPFFLCFHFLFTSICATLKR